VSGSSSLCSRAFHNVRGCGERRLGASGSGGSPGESGGAGRREDARGEARWVAELPASAPPGIVCRASGTGFYRGLRVGVQGWRGVVISYRWSGLSGTHQTPGDELPHLAKISGSEPRGSDFVKRPSGHPRSARYAALRSIVPVLSENLRL
jgi:hypothetical protein